MMSSFSPFGLFRLDIGYETIFVFSGRLFDLFNGFVVAAMSGSPSGQGADAVGLRDPACFAVASAEEL